MWPRDFYRNRLERQKLLTCQPLNPQRRLPLSAQHHSSHVRIFLNVKYWNIIVGSVFRTLQVNELYCATNATIVVARRPPRARATAVCVCNGYVRKNNNIVHANICCKRNRRAIRRRANNNYYRRTTTI